MPPRASAAEKGKAPAAPGDGGLRSARGAGAAAHDEAEPKDAVATTRRGGTVRKGIRARASPVRSCSSRSARGARAARAASGLLCYDARLAPVFRSALTQARPQRKAPRSSQAVAAGVGGSLALSGPFNKLDVELTSRIFSSLDTRTRLRCVSEVCLAVSKHPLALTGRVLTRLARQVCKGWRSLRRNPALWASISLAPPDFHHSANLLAFIAGPRSPLPSPDCVQSLELVSAPGKKAFNASSLKTALKTLSSATSVAIRGTGHSHAAKVTPDSFAVLTKQRAAPLKSLKLGEIKGLVVETALLDILASSPALTELEFDGTVTEAWVATAGSRASAALPLTALQVGDLRLAFTSGVNVAAFCSLGSTFPHLAVLRTSGARGMVANPLGGGDFIAPASLRAWAPLSALRSLYINSLCQPWDVHQLQQADAHEFVKRVVDAAPGLRSLHLSRGNELESMEEMMNRIPHVYAPMLDLCGPDLCGIGSLQHLEELTLAYFGLKPASCTGSSFPKLERLVLDKCGPYGAAAAAAIAGSAPVLKRLEITDMQRTASSGETGPGADGFASLASTSLTELRFDCGEETFGFGESTLVVHESSRGVGNALRDMAARGALPALRVLSISHDWQRSHRLPSDTFQVAHPWPKLERLELPDASAADEPELSTLRAPLLAHLTMQSIKRNVVSHDIWGGADAYSRLYDKLRVNLPSLAPLRYEEKPESRTVAPDAGAAGGAAAGSDSD